MHHRQVTRVLSRVGGGAPVLILPSYLRDGLCRFLCVITEPSAAYNRNSSNTLIQPKSDIKRRKYLIHFCHKNVTQNMAGRNLSCAKIGHSKRCSCDLSPAQSHMQKKSKGKKVSEAESFIQFNGLPLPKSSNSSSSISLDFIPLPKSAPLSPLDFIPLPKSPTPEKDLPDFFVLDTKPSVVTIDIPKPGDRLRKKDGKNVNDNKIVEKESSFIESKDYSKKTIEKYKSKSKYKISEVVNLSDHEDDIGILYEDQGKRLGTDMSVSSLTSLNSRESRVGLLNPGRSVIADQQTRNCHSYTQQGFKTKKDLIHDIDSKHSNATSKPIGIIDLEIETVDDLEDIEIIDRPIERTPVLSIEQIARNIKSKRNKLSNKNSSVDSFGVDVSCNVDKDFLLQNSSTETKKSPKASCSEQKKTSREFSPNIKKIHDLDPDAAPYSPEQQHFTIFNVDSSPEVHSADVLEIENGNYSYLDSDVSDVGSDHEVVDMELGEQEDVTVRDFVALDSSICVKELENTKIDLSDEILDMRQDLENIRQWEMTGLGQEVILDNSGVRQSDVIFTLLSYNVLAQKLLTDNMYLYKECEEEHLSWDYRWALLQHEISQIDPDVLTLQEVQASHWNSHYKPWMLYKGYDAVYKKRTGGKCDGVAIFFKKDKFSLVEYTPVEYLQPRSGGLLDRDNVGIIAKLQSLESPRSPPVCFGTTHLLFNPRRHDVKLSQVVLFLTELDRMSYIGEKFGKVQYGPVVITGDFNAEPHSAVLEFVKNGRIGFEGLNNRTLSRYGWNKGSLLGPQFLPPALGITDHCQHSVLAHSRFLEGQQGPLISVKEKRKLEESLIRISHPNNDDTEKFNGNLWDGPTHSGWFSHDFDFNSVYRHRVRRLKNAPEATTYHNNWTTVDYIMYNRVYSAKQGRPVEGNLKLLARYGLLGGSEAHRFSPLPSAVCPSDHFLLAAQFLLRK